jgi:ATP-dependent Lon protease
MPTIFREIPILPLPAVLFPGTFLPLDIADETQMTLLRDCSEEGQQLGVVFDPRQMEQTRPGIPYTTGCTASISLMIYETEETEVVRTVLYGEQRMRVVDFVQQDPYLTGRVELLEEYAGTLAERRNRQARELFSQYLELIRRRYEVDIINVPFPDDPAMMSYLLASVLRLPLMTKQRWLETVATDMRLREELAFLTDECEKLTALLTLAQRGAHRYVTPDYQLYTNLLSAN